MRSRASLCVFFLTALPLAAQPGNDKAASVEGIVINSLTAAPLPRVNIILQSETARYGTTSGADGRFALSVATPDSYRISGERVGFAPAVPEGERAVTVKPGEKKTGIEVRLAPTGTITGRVTDADGEPVEGAMVTAEGARGWTTTDEKGQYRIGGLAQYKYHVETAYHAAAYGGPPEIRSDGTAEIHFAPTYYPGVLSSKDAALVPVRPGTETSGIDIQLAPVPFVRVSGKIVGKPPGIAGSLLVSQGRGSNQIPVHTGDSFALWRLTPGKYTISAQWFNPDGASVRTSHAEIEVAGSNIDGIELRVVPDSDIAGHLEFESDEAKQTVPKDGARVALAGGDDDEDPEASIDEHGAFQLNKVSAGKHRVGLSWEGAYIKSMRLGPASIEGSVLDLNNGSAGAELTILVAAATGSITGAVHVDPGATEATTVVLTAAEPGTGFEARTADVDANGKYVLNSLPPGSYRIVAVAEDEVDFDDNSAIGFEDQMETVDVRDKEKVAKDLTAHTRAGR